MKPIMPMCVSTAKLIYTVDSLRSRVTTQLLVAQLREYEGDTSKKVKVIDPSSPVPSPQPVPTPRSSNTTAEGATAGVTTGGASSTSLRVETREGKTRTHPAPPRSNSPLRKAAKPSHKMPQHPFFPLDLPTDAPYSGPFQVRFVPASSFLLSVHGPLLSPWGEGVGWRSSSCCIDMRIPAFLPRAV